MRWTFIDGNQRKSDPSCRYVNLVLGRPISQRNDEFCTGSMREQMLSIAQREFKSCDPVDCPKYIYTAGPGSQRDLSLLVVIKPTAFWRTASRHTF